MKIPEKRQTNRRTGGPLLKILLLIEHYHEGSLFTSI